jgi:sulfur relay (sulfurtransferase) DsrC/TusE family protein
MKSQLKQGLKIEREHKPTYTFIKNYLKKHKKLPSQKLVFKHIAQNHIKEIPNYYTRLKRARL